MYALNLKLETPRKAFDIVLPKPMTIHEVREFARTYLGVRRGPETIELDGEEARAEFVRPKQEWEA